MGLTELHLYIGSAKKCVKTSGLRKSVQSSTIVIRCENKYLSLSRVPDTDDVKQKNKKHETIPSRFFPELKTNRSFVVRHLCPVHEVLTAF